MLSKVQKTTIEGKSVIDGVVVSQFIASINSDDPNQMTLSTVHLNKPAYKEHREAVRADEVEFEEYAFSVQNAMLAENSAPVAE